MKVVEAMTRDVTLIDANDTVTSAAKKMAEEDVGFLPVEESDRLVGMITDRDIVLRCVAKGKESDARVRDAMTADVRYCFEDDDLESVMENMAEQQVRRMPVMSRQKRLIGILSLADAARLYSPDIVGVAFSGVVMPGGRHAGNAARA